MENNDDDDDPFDENNDDVVNDMQLLRRGELVRNRIVNDFFFM